MGSAKSKNVAEAVANVSNFVSNSTSASTDQFNQVRQSAIFAGCNVDTEGETNVTYASDFVAKNYQIANAKNNTDLQNNVAQKMLQEATSKVGSLGIGYADASNSANETTNVSNSILNAMNVTAQQFSNTDQEFICINSTIKTRDLNINFSTSQDFFSSQTLDNTSVNNVVNDITQSIDQKATAVVEGLGSFLIALAILIGVIGYVLFKPLDSGPAKMAVGTGLCAVLAGLFLWSYTSSLPPFFSEPDRCIKYSNIGLGDSKCDFYKEDSITMKSAPLRYLYPLTKDYSPADKGNLLQFAIASASGQTISGSGGDNGGYRMDTMINLTNKIAVFTNIAAKMGIPNIPNPLYNPADKWKPKDNKPYYAISPQFSLQKLTGSSTDSCFTPATMCIDGNGSKFCPECPVPGKISYLSSQPIKIHPDCEILGTTSSPDRGVANFNEEAWKVYLEGVTGEEKTKRSLFARFVLGEIIGAGYEQNVYMKSYEPVRIQDDNGDPYITLASDAPGKVYKYVPNVIAPSYSNGQTGGGILYGEIGYCDTRKYHFAESLKKYGPFLAIFLLIIAFFAIAKPPSLFSVQQMSK